MELTYVPDTLTYLAEMLSRQGRKCAVINLQETERYLMAANEYMPKTVLVPQKPQLKVIDYEQ